MLPRQKRRAGGGNQAANKVTNAIYHKLTEVVDTMAVLTETQPLTDTIVLMVNCRDSVNWCGVKDFVALLLVVIHGHSAFLCGECGSASAECSSTGQSSKLLFVCLSVFCLSICFVLFVYHIASYFRGIYSLQIWKITTKITIIGCGHMII